MSDLSDKLVTPVPGTYVLAVSGGVDSVALLHALARRPSLRLIVAHADHGMREDSVADARFVEVLAQAYGLPFFKEELKLGAAASEARARKVRYQFLRRVQRQIGANAIVTAHHADDVLETAVLNLRRGTGWRGLCSLRSNENLLRPFLDVTKKFIYEYALAHRLEWVEDATNHTDAYTRNRIRRQLLPSIPPNVTQKLQKLIAAQTSLRLQIEPELQSLLSSFLQRKNLPQQLFKILESRLAEELLHAFYAQHNLSQTRPQRARAVQFLQTGHRNQRFSLDAQRFLLVTSDKQVVVVYKS